MKSFQKIFITCAVCTMTLFGMNMAGALTLSDVPSDYWAAGAIVESIEQNYLDVKGTNFYPEVPVTRAEFANAVYNLIQRIPLENPKEFNDVDYSTTYRKRISTLSQFKIIFG